MMTSTAKKQLRRRAEKRREERVAASIPVDLTKGSGMTRDVSATGIFFETEAQYAKGNTLDLTVEFDTPAGSLQLKCQGEIVRVEQRGALVGVAVKITDSILRYARD